MRKTPRQKIGVVGSGFVGSAVTRGFMEHADVLVYDVIPERCVHSLADVLECPIVFVCLPTPDLGNGAGCNLQYLDIFFDEVLHRVHTGAIFAIKSTVPPGYTKRLAQRIIAVDEDRAGCLVHQPEFLTARCSLVDFQTPARNLVGYPVVGDSVIDEYSRGSARTVADLLTERFPGVPCYVSTSTETELAKLGCNAFFALKVGFFNHLYEVAEALTASGDTCAFETIRRFMLSDGRIAHAHTAVPGPDGQFGYGGACLTKDLRNLAAITKQLGLDNRKLLDAVDHDNLLRRPDSSC